MKTYLFYIGLIFFIKGAYSQSLDTLFIEYNDRYFEQRTDLNDYYERYLIKNSGNNGQFYFTINKKISTLKFNKVVKIKSIVSNKVFYSGANNKLLDDWKLWEYFEKKTIFLIKKNCLYKLESQYEIE